MIRATKIIGMGLPKTGTHSLNKALQMMGLRSIHNPLNIREASFSGNFIAFREDAITNCAEWFFPRYEEIYTNVLFIYTTRNIDDWLRSCSRQFAEVPPEQTLRVRLSIFGVAKFQENIFREVYGRHEQFVDQYFRGRNNMLRIPLADQTDDKNWKDLRDFLGRSISKGEFPHEYRAIDKK